MAMDSEVRERKFAPLAYHTTPGLASEDDATQLAKLGYKQELRRSFTMLEIFGIAFSIMGLVPSIASTLPYSIPSGPAGMVWGWFIASGFIFIVGLAMADLGSAMPTSGGLYWWTHYFASPSTRNPLSFLVGYSNTLGLVGALCSIDYGFSVMFLSVIVIARDGRWQPSNGIIYATFVSCVCCHAVLASTLSKIMGKLQTIFVAMNFVLIMATIIALPIGMHKRNGGRYIFTHMENLTTWPTGWAFMLSWLSPIWTINAFDACVHMSEEAENAVKAVPYGILMSIGSCWIFGFVIMIVITLCINPDLKSIHPGRYGQPMAQIFYDAVGKNGTLGLMTLLFIVQFLMGLSILVAASRQSWAFSRDGGLPFSSWLRKVSHPFGFIPLHAIWGCALLASVLGLLCLIAPAAAQGLFSLMIAGNNVAYILPIFSRIWWGQRKFKPGPFYTGDLFSVPIAWVAIIFLVFGTTLSMFPIGGPHPTPQNMNYTVVINCAVWGGALLYYYIDARKWFTGPVLTLNTADLSEAQQQTLRKEALVPGAAVQIEEDFGGGSQGSWGSGEERLVGGKMGKVEVEEEFEVC